MANEELLREILTTQKQILAKLSEPSGELKLDELKIPGGIHMQSIAITTTMTTIKFSVPLISIALFNDGVDTVYVAINDKTLLQDQVAVTANSSISVDMDYPLIDSLYMVSVGTSDIRLFGVKGRKTANYDKFKKMIQEEYYG